MKPMWFEKPPSQWTRTQIERALADAQPSSDLYVRAQAEREHRKQMQQGRLTLYGIIASCIIGVAGVIATIATR